MLKNGQIEKIKTIKSYCGGKHRQGGQSQRRFERLFHEKVSAMYKKVEQTLARLSITKLLIGGSGNAKKSFVTYLHPQTAEKIVGLVDVSYDGFSGLREVLNKGSHFVEELKYTQEKKIYERFFKSVMNEERVVYGYTEVMNKLIIGVVDTIITTKEFWDEIKDELIEYVNTYSVEKQLLTQKSEEYEMFKKTFTIGGFLRF